MTRRTYGNRLTTLEERIAGTREELAERVATIMVKFINDVLDDLELTVEQRAVASKAVPRRIEEMKAALERGGTE